MTTSYPAAIKVQDQWFVVFGSGPTDYDGTSTKNGHIFVVDLLTGAPYQNGGNDWLFESNEAKAFMGMPVSLDKNLNFSVDSIYIGETYLSGSWKGKLYKIGVPALDALGDYDDTDAANYVTDPLDASDPWVLSTLCDATRPITAPPALSVDIFDNCWVYFGTGRYLSQADKTTADTNYLFGLKDPFFNKDHTTAGMYGTDYYHNYSTSLELTTADLFDADPYVVVEGDEVYLDDDSYYGTFTTLLTAARQENGWIKTLETPAERILTKPSVLGGVVFTPSFEPNSDVCGYGGQSYLYGQYYETGTAYPLPVFFVNGTRTVNIAGNDKVEVMYRTTLGEGKASAVGVHVGTEGAQALIQQSTGTIVSEALNPAINIRSGLQSWIDQ
jgi:type IV pilus assembly protein PilY1